MARDLRSTGSQASPEAPSDLRPLGDDHLRVDQSLIDMISEHGLSVCPQCNGGWVIEADDGSGEQEWEVVRTRGTLRAALREAAGELNWRLPPAQGIEAHSDGMRSSPAEGKSPTRRDAPN